MARAVTVPFTPTGKVYDLRSMRQSSLTDLLNAGQGDAFTLELIGGVPGQDGRWYSDTGVFNTEAALEISLDAPRPMTLGEVALSYGASTAPQSLPLRSLSAWQLQVSLNGLPAVHAAGGVEVNLIGAGLFRVTFNEAGSRAAIGVSHSEAGSMADRVTESRAGDGSTAEIQTLDFRVQKLAALSSWSPLGAATVAAAVVTSGSSSAHQHETITLSRPVEGGEFVVSVDGGDTWSDPVSCFGSAYDLQIALDALCDDTFTVSRVIDGLKTRFDVRRVRAGTITNAISVRALGIQSHAGKSGSVDWSSFRRSLALTGANGSLSARFILRTGPTKTGDVLDSGVTLIDSSFQFHPALAASPIDSALSPAP